MDYRTLLEQAQHYVRTLYDSQMTEKLYYHNLRHTEKVAEAATQIAQHFGTPKREHRQFQAGAPEAIGRCG